MSIPKQKTDLFFRLSISLTVFSALFKFIPTPLLLLGATGMLVSLGIQLYQKGRSTALDYARFLLVLSFFGNYVFLLLNSPFAHVPTLLTKLALVIFLVLYIKKIVSSFRSMSHNTSLLLSSFGRDDLSFLLADLATVYIVVASLFIVLQWQIGMLNGNVLLAIGLFSALVSLLATGKQLEKQ